MTGRYKAYPEYKDSNLEWLGEVPEHWGVDYSKWLFEERNNKAKKTDEMLTASQKYGVIPQKMFMELEQQKVVQVQKGHDILKQVKKNDFVISMRSFQGGIEFCGFDGAVSSAYVPLEPQNENLSGFFKYLFKSKPYIQALQATTNLVRDGQALRYTNFIQVRLPVPTESEAVSIGEFLDHETSKLDTLITKQEKLIELLKEKRQAVISHAVTKGLNPDAPMKDSGVEWLGEVPEHWDITKTAWHFVAEKGKNGQVLTKEYIGQNNGDYPVYSGQTGNNGVMGCINTYEFDTGKEGVLFSTTVGAKAMTLNHLKGKFSLSQNCLIIQKTSPIFNTRFCFYHFQPLFSFERGLIPEHMQASFRMEDLYQYKIALPSFEEQQRIANFLDHETAKIDTLITKQEKLIELMKERKTALISAAVTGKIDVR